MGNGLLFDTSAIVKIYHQEDGSEAILPFYKGNVL